MGLNGYHFRSVIYNAAEQGNLKRIQVFTEPWKTNRAWVQDVFNEPEERDPDVIAGKKESTIELCKVKYPLVIAARNGHEKTVEYLLQIGADPSVRGCVEFDNDNIKGTPPLWAASAAGHLGIVKLLVEQANADVNQATNTQSTPLRGACYDGHLDIVKYLLEHGADPHLPNRHGHTCLMIASYRNKVGIVEELLSFGVDVNKQTERGNSALHDAAESGNIEVVNLLFEHGAKMVKDLHGVDPLICAAQSGCPEVLEVLKQHEPSAIRRRDALKLIGATFMDKKMDAMAAMDYWRQAMDVELSEDDQKIVREMSILTDTLACYDHEREIQNHDSVQMLDGNIDAQRMQSLVIRERVLGGSHSDVHYYLRFRGAVYCDMGQLNKCYDLWKHALELQQTHFAPLHLGTVTTFQSFQETFVMTINDFINQHHQLPGLRVKSSWVKYLFDRICLELERVVKYQGNLLEDTECCGREPCIHATEDGEIQKLVIVAVHLVNIIDRLSLPSMENSAEKDEDLAEKDVKLDVERLLRSCHLKRIPFLHYALEERLHDPESLPKAAVLAQFLECPDVDVNSKDKNGNTPLHIVLQARVPRGSLISLLLRHGAYLLARNDDGVVVWNELKRMHQGVTRRELYEMKLGRYLTLGGIAANAMRIKYADSFEGVETMLPRELKDFYLAH